MKLVVLDRDGTINHDSDQYIKSPAEWKPIKGSIEAIARLTQAGPEPDGIEREQQPQRRGRGQARAPGQRGQGHAHVHRHGGERRQQIARPPVDASCRHQPEEGQRREGQQQRQRGR